MFQHCSRTKTTSGGKLMDNIEIERKFLVKKLPDNLENYPKKGDFTGIFKYFSCNKSQK